MGIETIGAIIGIVTSVVGIGQSLFGGAQASDAADNRAQLEQQRVNLAANQRAIELARDKEDIARKARAQQATLINRAAAGGAMYTSTTAGGVQAIDTNLRRENDYISTIAGLGSESDSITRQQIELDRGSTQTNISNQVFNTTVRGLGTLATSGLDLYTSVGRGETPDKEEPNSDFTFRA